MTTVNKETVWTPAMRYIQMSKYSRWREDLGRRETWAETTDRYVGFFQKKFGDRVPAHVWSKVRDSIFNMRSLGSMRATWTAGDCLEENNITGYNCCLLPIIDLRALVELFYILMCGTGVGFSVENHYIANLPIIKRQTGNGRGTHKVGDSREGWADALAAGLDAWFNGDDIDFDFSGVRKKGMRLKKMGGRASGPEPLMEMLRTIRQTVLVAAGRRLTDLETSDICNLIADVVQVGGIRRASEIGFSDTFSMSIRDAKTGNYPNYRRNSNNSAVYFVKPTMVDFMAEWSALAKSGTGERGIFNLQAVEKKLPRRRTFSTELRTNPCFHPDTRLATEHGLVRVRDLCENYGPISVVADTRIGKGDSFHSNAYGTTKLAATSVFLTQQRAPVFEVVTSHGYRVTTTADHDFVTTSGRKPLSCLVLGDTLPLPSGVGLFGSDGTYEEGLVLGTFVGDGVAVEGDALTASAFIDIWDADVSSLDSMRSAVHLAIANVTRYGGYDKLPQWTKTAGCKSRIGGRRLSRALSAMSDDGEVSSLKCRVPERVWKGSREFVEGYIAGLFFADGTINVAGHAKKTTVSWRINQSNLELLRDVQILLSQFGVVSRIYLRRRAGERKLPDGRGGLATYWCKDNYELVVNRPNLVVLNERVRLFGRKQALVCDALKMRGVDCQKPERYLTKVVSISPVGETDVYCLTQPTTNCVISNGIVNGQCGEIILRPFEFCNLSEVVVRAGDEFDDLVQKVEVAVWLGAMQSCLTDFPYIRPEFKKNCDEEHLLGISLTGQMDNPRLLTADRVSDLKKYALKVARKACSALGITMSVAITCGKPSGTLSQLVNASSGMHARHAPYYIRRFRENATNPIYHLLKAQGVKFFPEVGQENKPEDQVTTWVFEVPEAAPKGAVTRSQMTATEQLEWYLKMQKNWCEHNQSCTVYVRDEEWLAVGAWVYAHWDDVVGITFLPYDGGVYKLAPYEEITKEEYERRLKEFPVIDWSQLTKYEVEDTTAGARTYACTADRCEL